MIVDDELLTPEEVSALTKGAVSPSNLAQRRYRGVAPAWVAPTPRTILYKRSVVIAWLEASERTSTAERISA